MTGHPTPMETIQQRSRANKSASQKTAQSTARPTQRGVSPDRVIPIVCYTCFLPHHTSRDCPHKQHVSDPKWIDFFVANFRKLAKWLQEYLISKGKHPSALKPSNDNAESTCLQVPVNPSREGGGGAELAVTPTRVSFNDNVAVINHDDAPEAQGNE